MADWGPHGSSLSSRSEPVSDPNSMSTNAACSGLVGKLIKAFIPLDQWKKKKKRNLNFP